MTRAWDELAADVFDVVPPGLQFLILLTFAALAGALWFWYPLWIPKRRPKRAKVAKDEEPERVITAAEPEAPDEPRPIDLSLADRLAAEGRYAEAIRQRLRVTLGELVAARLVPAQPGWTAAELAAIAGGQRPAVAAPLATATQIFSEVWYGRRPAERFHDQRMLAVTEQVRAALRETDGRALRSVDGRVAS
ncbi:DUF4129 domain-containing protein [Actinoplanes sp. NPDC051633]|uniref:DUF4129 domain-containing protein n=1 Tax=Actinoplanes sp. NPDC051633 TaxID=3155670 RepID=UPI00342D8C67